MASGFDSERIPFFQETPRSSVISASSASKTALIGGKRGRLRFGFFGVAFELIEEVDRAAKMRDHDRAADDEADAEDLEELVTIDASLAALCDVIADAIVATQYQRSD